MLQIRTLILFPKLELNEIFAEVVSDDTKLFYKYDEFTNINEVCRMMAIKKFNTFKMYVDLITNFRGCLQIKFNFIYEGRRC